MIDCKKIVDKIKQEIKQDIENNNKFVQLAIIQVGDNPASNKYVSGKISDCKEVGIDPVLYQFDENIEEDRIINLIEELNNDNKCNGIIVQLPLPKTLHEEKILNKISYAKDVDGFRYKSSFTPCTPKGVITILEELGVDLVGKNVTLVGYGKLVNKPLMNLLSDRGATVTVCRSHTPLDNLREYCKMSDVIVTAVGKYNTINHTCINMIHKPVIIDCGIDVLDEIYTDENNETKVKKKQYGDCHIGIYDICDNVTYRINGVGIMTRVSLMQNTLEAYNKQNN